MLKEINDALSALGLPVFYGQAGTMEGQDLWDYVVFWRDTVSSSINKNGLTDNFSVALIQENYCDEDKINAIFKAMKSIPGVRFATSGATFERPAKGIRRGRGPKGARGL